MGTHTQSSCEVLFVLPWPRCCHKLFMCTPKATLTLVKARWHKINLAPRSQDRSKLRFGSVNHRLQGCCLSSSSPQSNFSSYVNAGTFYRALATALQTPKTAHPSLHTGSASLLRLASHTIPAFHNASQNQLKGQPEDYKYLERTAKTIAQVATTEH